MIQTGTKLAHYEVVSALGKGGMGEVWRARDTKLGREVAIKTLPAEFAEDTERLSRFEREAKLLASLNHPNIAAIHGFEEDTGTHFLVMELVEGDTLAERVGRGAIPVEESLGLALQIAEALEAAHGRGVIHRDLKPANVKITPEGKLKVLDFGLAKAFTAEGSAADLANSPTLSMQATQQGMILGTAAYMSPEQAQGEEVDRRTDIWAFGCVLYEMLTGRAVFASESVSRTLARVLEREADLSLLPANLDPRVTDLIERCLEKESRKRWHDVADVRGGIEKIVTTTSGVRPKTVVEPSTGAPSRRLPWILAAGGFVIAAVLGGLLWRVPDPAPGVVMRFSIPLPEDQGILMPAARAVGVSRDGTRMAYSAGNQIYIRDFGQAGSRLLSGASTQGLGIGLPVFSPDGESLVFAVVRAADDATLMQLPVSGGTAVPLWTGPLPTSVSWPDEDTILFSIPGGIARIPANGGEQEILIAAADGEVLESPQLLPGGEQILFTSGRASAWDAGTIFIQSIGGDERTEVLQGGSDASYLSSGHVIYANGSDLYALPFDLDRLEATGGVVSVLQGARRSALAQLFDTAQYVVSDNGTLVHIPGTANAQAGESAERSLVWVNEDGNETTIPVPTNAYTLARISPDLTRVALTVEGDIWVYDLETGTGGPITSDGDNSEASPIWSADDRILYFSNRPDAPGVYSIPSAGGVPTLVASNQNGLGTHPSSISPDGNTLFVMDLESASTVHIAALDLSSPDEFERVVSGDSVATHPAIAPNGDWIASLENLSRQNPQILIRPFPDVNRQRLPVDPGPRPGQTHPLFSPDGSELFYLVSGQGIFSVDIAYEPGLNIGLTPRLALSGPYRYGVSNATGQGGRAWDRHPDGRFLMIRDGSAPTEGEAPGILNQINVISNWFEVLKERAPVD